jgi:putative membrane-bound dehydrogenase-like protein
MPSKLRLIPLCLAGCVSLTNLCPAQTPPAVPDSPVATSAATESNDTVDKDYSSELPRLPALSIEEVIKSLEVADGFELKLIAHEPLVFDPVAFAFDAHLRLYVVEMRDYSEQETEHLGSIARLEDTDGDGVFDKRTVMVEGLSWPTAIWPWKDGVIVAEPPRLTWYRDTDGDGRSDQSEDWYIGFGRGNVQGLVNSLKWGVDGFLHGATSSSGAELESPMNPNSPDMALGRRDFAIDPVTRALVAEAGGGQHGMSFNRWGDKFATSNSDHLQQIIDLEWWLQNHPTSVALPSTRRSIAMDGPQAEVYRSSPVEPWRIVRTRLRMSGVAPGVVEGGGRAAGYFTGATGNCIMDREAGFGDGELDTAIMCDVGSNLVHRKRMHDQGLFWSGERIDQESELLRSSDVWFRPVQVGDGPDGSLMVADMAREVIEHPKSLPPMIKKHLDLTSGRDRGRIWKVTPKSAVRRSDPAPASLSSAELVANLAHPVTWQRRMASQLLIERQATDVRAELEQAALNTASPEAQVLAMHVLHRLQLFSAELAQKLVQTQHPRVLQHAIRLVGLNKLSVGLEGLSASESPRIQLEVALASSAVDKPKRDALLTKLLPQAHEPLVQAIVASVAGDDSWRIVERQASTLSRADRSAWLRLLLPQWSQNLQKDAELRRWMLGNFLNAFEPGRDWRRALASAASRADLKLIRDVMSAEQQSQFDGQIELDLEAAMDSATPGIGDFQVVRLVGAEAQSLFSKQMLRPTSHENAQRAVLGLLSWSDQASIAELVIKSIASMTPALQTEALRGLAGRAATAVLLADSIDQGIVQVSQIPLELREQLRRSQDKAVASRFETLFGKVSSDRQEVIERYSVGLNANNTAEDYAGGEQVFRQVCAQCHRLNDLGNDVGPPLKQLADKSPQQLLEAILDPNREIDPKYMSYTVLDEDDRVLTGIIQDETSGQIVLKSPGGEIHTLARQAISELKSSGVSLMPVGLEASISAEQMRQLIQFLKSSRP